MAEFDYNDPHFNTIQGSVPTPSIFGVVANSAQANSATPVPSKQGDDNAPLGSVKWHLDPAKVKTVLDSHLKGTPLESSIPIFMKNFIIEQNIAENGGRELDQDSFGYVIAQSLMNTEELNKIAYQYDQKRGATYKKGIPDPVTRRQIYSAIMRDIVALPFQTAALVQKPQEILNPGIGETSVDQAQFGMLPVGSRTDGMKNPQSNNNAATSSAAFTGGQELNAGDVTDSTGSADGVPASVRFQETSIALEAQKRRQEASETARQDDMLTDIGKLALMAMGMVGAASAAPAVIPGMGAGLAIDALVSAVAGKESQASLLNNFVQKTVSDMWFGMQRIWEGPVPTSSKEAVLRNMQRDMESASTAQDPSRKQAVVGSGEFRKYVWRTALDIQAAIAIKSLGGRDPNPRQRDALENLLDVRDRIDGLSYPPVEGIKMSMTNYRASGANGGSKGIAEDLRTFIETFVPQKQHYGFVESLDMIDRASIGGRAALRDSAFRDGPTNLPPTGNGGGRYKDPSFDTHWGDRAFVRTDADSNAVNQPSSIPYSVLTTLQQIPQGQTGTLDDRGSLSSHVPRVLTMTELFLTEDDMDFLNDIANPFYEADPFEAEGIEAPRIGYGIDSRGPLSTVSSEGVSELQHVQPARAAPIPINQGTSSLPYSKSLRATGQEQGSQRRGRKKARKTRIYKAR